MLATQSAGHSPDAGDTVRRAQQTRPEGERLHSVIVPRDRPTRPDTRGRSTSRGRKADRRHAEEMKVLTGGRQAEVGLESTMKIVTACTEEVVTGAKIQNREDNV